VAAEVKFTNTSLNTSALKTAEPVSELKEFAQSFVPDIEFSVTRLPPKGNPVVEKHVEACCDSLNLPPDKASSCKESGRALLNSNYDLTKSPISHVQNGHGLIAAYPKTKILFLSDRDTPEIRALNAKFVDKWAERHEALHLTTDCKDRATLATEMLTAQLAKDPELRRTITDPKILDCGDSSLANYVSYIEESRTDAAVALSFRREAMQQGGPEALKVIDREIKKFANSREYHEPHPSFDYDKHIGYIAHDTSAAINAALEVRPKDLSNLTNIQLLKRAAHIAKTELRPPLEHLRLAHAHPSMK
jgi:hypothetical protein